MPGLSFDLLLLAVLIFAEDACVRRAQGAALPPGRAVASVHNGSATLPERRDGGISGSPAESPLILRVGVKDAVSQRPLGGALVQLFVNGSRTHSSVTHGDGELLLSLPYRLGQMLTLTASMDGYVLTQLPWSTSRTPIFSSVTLSLVPHTQGNVWLFEDNVLITQRTSDLASQPRVLFSKSLLTLPENTSVSMVTAYLTVLTPRPEKNCPLCTARVISSQSGLRSVKLNPVAMLSAQLVSRGMEVEVQGAIQLSVPLAYPSSLRPSDSVPAWAFDLNTGTWVHKGAGVVGLRGERLVWTYTAPHLGTWIAAPLPTSSGYMGHPASVEFISYHTYLLVGIVGGTLVIVIGFLSVLLCHCRDVSRASGRSRRSAARLLVPMVPMKDQATSTCTGHAQEALCHHDDMSYSLAARSVGGRDLSASPRNQANYNIYVEDVGRPLANLYENVGAAGPEPYRAPLPNIYVNSDEVARLRERSEQNGSHPAAGGNVAFHDKLFHIYNQPVALVQAAPELFAAQGPADASGCRSATFPRNGAEHGPQADRNYKDSFTQTLPKAPQQDGEEPPALQGAQGSATNPGIWGRYSHLLESVSVPGTLNEAAGMGMGAGMGTFRGELQGISEQTLVELSKAKPSPHPPRAWFVSLDGKPVAQVRHSVIELQGRRRPGSSNDTSLDSGVDMNELQQPLRKGERDGPPGGSLPKAGTGGLQEEQDLSSSEIGSPEDGALRNALAGSSAAIPSIPEDRDAGDTSSESRSTPPPRRPRKLRDKRPEKKTTRHNREERPHMRR